MDSEPVGKSARILLVDDNEDAADMLSEILRSHGYDVCVAFDGLQALQLAESFVPAVAILDIGLPGMDGYELAVRLRELPGFLCLPLIALSGYDSVTDAMRAELAGFDKHLGKPVDLAALRRVVDQLLHRSARGL